MHLFQEIKATECWMQRIWCTNWFYSPPANPVKKRPTYNIATDVAHMMHAHPIANGRTSASSVVFRPIRSMTRPIIKQLMMPPTLEFEPIHENCSGVTGKPYAWSSTIFDWVGELQPSIQPAASAPLVAKSIDTVDYFIGLEINLLLIQKVYSKLKIYLSA